MQGHLTTVLSNYVPSHVEKHMQFLDFNSLGELFLGTSSLNTRFWTGALWYYGAGIEPEKVDSNSCKTGLHTQTGVLDGRFLKDDLVVVGLDNGGIQVVRLTSEEDDREFEETLNNSLQSNTTESPDISNQRFVLIYSIISQTSSHSSQLASSA